MLTIVSFLVHFGPVFAPKNMPKRCKGSRIQCFSDFRVSSVSVVHVWANSRPEKDKSDLTIWKTCFLIFLFSFCFFFSFPFFFFFHFLFISPFFFFLFFLFSFFLFPFFFFFLFLFSSFWSCFISFRKIVGKFLKVSKSV